MKRCVLLWAFFFFFFYILRRSYYFFPLEFGNQPWWTENILTCFMSSGIPAFLHSSCQWSCAKESIFTSRTSITKIKIKNPSFCLKCCHPWNGAPTVKQRSTAQQHASRAMKTNVFPIWNCRSGLKSDKLLPLVFAWDAQTKMLEGKASQEMTAGGKGLNYDFLSEVRYLSWDLSERRLHMGAALCILSGTALSLWLECTYLILWSWWIRVWLSDLFCLFGLCTHCVGEFGSNLCHHYN